MSELNNLVRENQILKEDNRILRETNDLLKEKIKLYKSKIYSLESKAFKDQLTNAYNRHGMYERIINSNSSYYSLVSVDIDNFKFVNDYFGHDEGDIVLKTIVDIIIYNMRETDFLVRFGGDEFYIFFSEMSLEHTLVRLKEIKTRMKIHPVIIKVSEHELIPKDKVISLSMGIDIYESTEDRLRYSNNDELDYNLIFSDLELIKNRVDSLLYESKKTGKNKIVLASSKTLKK